MDKYIRDHNKKEGLDVAGLLMFIIVVLLCLVVVLTVLYVGTNQKIDALATERASMKIEQKERVIESLRRQLSEKEWELQMWIEDYAQLCEEIE